MKPPSVNNDSIIVDSKLLNEDLDEDLDEDHDESHDEGLDEGHDEGLDEAHSVAAIMPPSTVVKVD